MLLQSKFRSSVGLGCHSGRRNCNVQCSATAMRTRPSSTLHKAAITMPSSSSAYISSAGLKLNLLKSAGSSKRSPSRSKGSAGRCAARRVVEYVKWAVSFSACCVCCCCRCCPAYEHGCPTAGWMRAIQLDIVIVFPPFGVLRVPAAR